jgi:undecaprenyl-diphosphatase
LLWAALAVLAVIVAAGLALSAGEARTWWQVVALGIVEGLTEFLPISSTAHLLIASRLLGFENSIGGTFEIFIQLGAIVAVVVFYARDLLAQARALPSSPQVRHFWLAILVAFLPAAVIGVLLRSWIKAVLFDSPVTIALSLIVGGLVLIAVELRPQRRAATTDVERVSFRQALGVGIAQVFALVPGVSRSGATMVGGLLGGLDRRAATAFAFYLAIPTLGAATIVDLLGSLDQITSGDMARLAVGAVVSFAVAWLSIGWLLRYVANHSFVAFGIYRILAGLVILGLLLGGVMV